MNFHFLDEKINEQKNYKVVANYIIENNINIIDFFEGLETLKEENEQGVFSRVGGAADSWFGKLRNWWSGFRGNPYDIESVIKLLQKAEVYLKNNQKDLFKYKNEIQSLSKIIDSMKIKQNFDFNDKDLLSPVEREEQEKQKEFPFMKQEDPKQMKFPFMSKDTK